LAQCFTAAFVQKQSHRLFCRAYGSDKHTEPGKFIRLRRSAKLHGEVPKRFQQFFVLLA
jgi:hypothetical protein